MTNDMIDRESAGCGSRAGSAHLQLRKSNGSIGIKMDELWYCPPSARPHSVAEPSTQLLNTIVITAGGATVRVESVNRVFGSHF